MNQLERYAMRRRAIWHYAIADPDFYEPLDRYRAGEELIQIVESLLPVDWRIVRSGVWQQVQPHSPTERIQGWKIHVSATMSNHKNILKIASSICIKLGLSFKFSCDTEMFRMMNTRIWEREGSGKFITIYPRNDDEFKHTIEELYLALKNFEGPYILSDKRYKDCKVLYYRYGGIKGMERLNYDGSLTPVIMSPVGNLISDIRTPCFNHPDWVKDPFPVAGEPEADFTLKDGKYIITRSLSFSNVGGVYVGYEANTGTEVIIKEARPNTDYQPRDMDSFKLRQREWFFLNELKHTGLVPEPIDLFEDWEHLFIVQSYLQDWIPLRRYPSMKHVLFKIKHTDFETELEQYFRDVIQIGKLVSEGMEIIHDHGIIIGDFSYNNVLIHPETLEIKFIDFEGAYNRGSDEYAFLTTPGFVSPNRHRSHPPQYEDDYYALGSLLFFLVVPTGIVPSNSDAVEIFLNEFEKDYSLPEELTEVILSLTAQTKTKRPNPEVTVQRLDIAEANLKPHASTEADRMSDMEILSMRDGIVNHILATLTSDRSDRIIRASFDAKNPLDIAHGAVGVAYALKTMIGESPKQIMEWILRRYSLTNQFPVGLYEGLSGIAWALADMGYMDEALDIYKKAEKHPQLFEAADIYNGMAGFGLTSLYFWTLTREDRFLNWGTRVAAVLDQSRLKHEDEEICYWKPPDEKFTYIGYTQGASGIALFLLYLHLATQESRFIEMGKKALKSDLNFAHENPDGVSFPEDSESSIVYPYWFNGSAGVGTTLLRYLMSGYNEFEDMFQKLVPDTTRKYTAWPGLFKGLTGLGNFLLDCYQLTGDRSYLTDVHRAVKGVSLFKIDTPSGIAFPGDGLIRLCTDFGSGSAGIALFLDRVLHQKSNFNFKLDSLLPSDRAALSEGTV